MQVIFRRSHINTHFTQYRRNKTHLGIVPLKTNYAALHKRKLFHKFIIYIPLPSLGEYT